MTFLRIVAIAAGGALGAVLRYVISYATAGALGTGFPLGTYLVNMLGCLTIGFLMAGPTHLVAHPELQALLVTGLLGAFTTFSTFSLETVILFQRGDLIPAAANVVASLVVGLGAVVAGGWIARAVAKVV